MSGARCRARNEGGATSLERETGRATVRSLGGGGEDLGRMAEDVRTGLLGVPKDLSPWPKYFYDEKGSEIVARTRCRELVELGSGSASKTRALLDAMTMAGRDADPVCYVPFDVSES